METAALASAMVTISEDLSVGMDASYAKRITNEDILAFAELSGDVNPIHLSDEFAASTIFKKRIAHGFLTGSLFSTVLGTKLPGPGCVYLSQTMKFRGPVYIGDQVVAMLKITALDPDKARVTFAVRLLGFERQDRPRRRSGAHDGRPTGPARIGRERRMRDGRCPLLAGRAGLAQGCPPRHRQFRRRSPRPSGGSARGETDRRR